MYIVYINISLHVCFRYLNDILLVREYHNYFDEYKKTIAHLFTSTLHLIITLIS